MSTTQPQHIPYRSLEQFRLSLTQQYLDIYKNDVVVQEKIHGSNISIIGFRDESSLEKWNFSLGSRRRLISDDEKFNNIQSLFKQHKGQIIALFNNLYDRFCVDKSDYSCIIRLFGEIFGGKYGGETTPGAIKTQIEPNYGPSNDFAFFDAFVENICIPIDDLIETIPQFGLRIPPVIYRGPLADFLSSFDVNSFKSVISNEFYGLDFIDQPKATEGVVIRTINPKAIGNEATILKYKQTWAVENPRINRKENHTQNISHMQDCLAMMNQNRLTSYKSKHTIEDLTNSRLIGNHVKELVEDTMKDVIEEFPPSKYPEINQRDVSRALSKKTFPMFRKFIECLERETLSCEDRVRIISNEHKNLLAEINSLKNRLQNIQVRINSF